MDSPERQPDPIEGGTGAGLRADRVEAVRDKLAGGTLGVEPERIARALLDQGVVSF